MNTDEKILQALSALQAEVTAIKTEHGKRFDGIEKRLDQQGNILAALASNGATVLEEQQQQRTALRSLHDDLHRVEQKIDKGASVGKSNEERIENLEETVGVPNPHKH